MKVEVECAQGELKRSKEGPRPRGGPGTGWRRTLPAGLMALILLMVAFPSAGEAQGYFPGAHPDWERREPAEVGFDPDALQDAIELAIASESEAPRDLRLNHDMTFGREPRGEAIGPFGDRGPQTGLVIRHGYIVAEWGEPARVDQTFSIAKSFLSTTVGIAVDEGVIRSVDDRVGDYMPPIVLEHGDGEPGDQDGRRPKLLFESEHNRRITWDHLLRQTSDWEGTLWGKPEWADRPDRDPSTWLTRPRNEPGTVYEYNDTRVNLLALAATAVWRKPLAEVLHERVMAPIGASTTWQWHGYENSWINLNGHRVQVVSGGSHWGGGMFINAYDQARLGLLTLHEGRWGNRRIVSEDWVDRSRVPGSANSGYGFMNYFLNTDGEMYPSAPEEAWAHRGAGANIVYVDPVHDLVVVTRWIQGSAFDAVIEHVLAALDEG
ncbi:MAG: serine hydrolase [Gemmatimonadota bacterium]|nr:serine hydrolase [Gemmatimonadota bacterium]